MTAIADVALRTPLVRLQVPESPAGDLAEARVPPADRLVQDPRCGQRDPQRPSRSDRARRADHERRATWRRGSPWIAREEGIPATIVVPDHAPQTKLDAIERLGGR